MNKIYGFKQEDIIELAGAITKNKNRSLSQMFNEVAKAQNKSAGTIRNMYYALAKLSKEDDEFCKKYLDGRKILVGKIKEFNLEDERKLLKSILIKKKDGKSIRGASLELSKGDGALALRYQNKYRSSLCKKPNLIAEIIAEIKEETGEVIEQEDKQKSIVSEVQFTRLKNEINNLVNKIALKEKRENEYLKQRLSFLEVENARLNLILRSENSRNKATALKYFTPTEKPKILN